MPLLTHKERTERNQEKTMRVLRFLRESIYTTAPILGQLLGLTSRIAIYKTLRALEKKSLVRHQEFEGPTGTPSTNFTLWGITAVGQEAALQDGDERTNVVFNSGKISLKNLPHYLSIQRIRVLAERENWTNFIYCDRRALDQTKTDDTINQPQRPDLLATDPSGRRVAIESERTLKRIPLYKDHVLPGHVRRINADEYQYVVWVCQQPQKEKTLRHLLTTAIRELSEEKALHLEKTTPGIKTFNVTNLTTWPKF
jgi:hypothetical protein